MKPSILLVGNFLSARGVNRTLVEEFSEGLASAGYTLITTSRIYSRLPRLMDMLWTAFSCRNSYQIAYVEVYSDAAFIWAELVCALLRLLRKPYLLALHGGSLPIFARRWPGRVKRLLDSAAAVAAPSGFLQKEMSPYRKDIVLIPNSLFIKNYTFRLRSAPRPSLVWLRAFHDIYNPQMVPRLIDHLRIPFPDIVLEMIGPDKADGALQETQAEIEKLSLQNYIEIVPGIPKSEVPAYLSRSDIFINTANVDNTPVSVLEAMACGLCVVSTNVGGIPYLLQDGQDALLVEPNDPCAMAAAVQRVLTEPGLAEQFSGNGRRKVEQFEWLVVLQQWQAIFERMIWDG
jgi:glycosyltransferase involved in cell wall biosynthesis